MPLSLVKVLTCVQQRNQPVHSQVAIEAVEQPVVAAASTQDLLHRKDAVIDELQSALQSSQRQTALLRGAQRSKDRINGGHSADVACSQRATSAGKLAQRGTALDNILLLSWVCLPLLPVAAHQCGCIRGLMGDIH